MKDSLIREHFHKKVLEKYHLDTNTRVVDELGLNHGDNRADIAIINGRLIGFEIKSNKDTLSRLEEQIKAYNAIFDSITIIVGDRHFRKVLDCVPPWWGVVLANIDILTDVKFTVFRKPTTNQNVDPIAIARLLWRDEALNILQKKGASPAIHRKPREFLYELLSNTLRITALRRSVRETLKQRSNWRRRESLLQDDDLSRSVAKS